MKNKTLSQLLKLIPGGAHTYSRGYDQFPSNAPTILKSGKGAYVFSKSGKSYLYFSEATDELAGQSSRREF